MKQRESISPQVPILQANAVQEYLLEDFQAVVKDREAVSPDICVLSKGANRCSCSISSEKNRRSQEATKLTNEHATSSANSK